MGRIIRQAIDNVSVTTDADQDVWELTAGANNKLVLHEFVMYSAATTAEALRLRLIRRTGAGTGGTAATEVRNDEDDGAITAAVATLVTTPGTPGDILEGYQWEQLGPLQRLWTPETRPVVQEGGRLGLNLSTALGSATNWSGLLIWEEI